MMLCLNPETRQAIATKPATKMDWEPLVSGLQKAIGSIKVAPEITFQGPDGMREALLSLADVYSQSIAPLVKVLRSKTTLELKSYKMLEEMTEQLESMEKSLRERADTMP
jgi:hypothetical protein